MSNIKVAIETLTAKATAKAEEARERAEAEKTSLEIILSSIVGVDYRWVNRIVKTTKAGKKTDKSSRAILTVKLDDGVAVDLRDFCENNSLYLEGFNEFCTVLNPLTAKVQKVALADMLGLPVSDKARQAAQEAADKLSQAAEKRIERRRKTYEDGEKKFMGGRKEEAVRAWEKLVDEFGE